VAYEQALGMSEAQIAKREQVTEEDSAAARWVQEVPRLPTPIAASRVAMVVGKEEEGAEKRMMVREVAVVEASHYQRVDEMSSSWDPRLARWAMGASVVGAALAVEVEEVQWAEAGLQLRQQEMERRVSEPQAKSMTAACCCSRQTC
jgi:hypothetical protein